MQSQVDNSVVEHLLGDLNVVQLVSLSSLGLSLEEVWQEVWSVLLWLDSLGSWKKVVSDGTLGGSEHSEVSGVGLLLWQSSEGLLHEWVLLVDEVVELKTHLSVAGVGTEELGSWDKNSGEGWGTENEVTGLDDGSVCSWHCRRVYCFNRACGCGTHCVLILKPSCFFPGEPPICFSRALIGFLVKESGKRTPIHTAHQTSSRKILREFIPVVALT